MCQRSEGWDLLCTSFGTDQVFYDWHSRAFLWGEKHCIAKERGKRQSQKAKRKRVSSVQGSIRIKKVLCLMLTTIHRYNGGKDSTVNLICSVDSTTDLTLCVKMIDLST